MEASTNALVTSAPKRRTEVSAPRTEAAGWRPITTEDQRLAVRDRLLAIRFRLFAIKNRLDVSRIGCAAQDRRSRSQRTVLGFMVAPGSGSP
jgi:hypothetical protein